MLIEVFLQFLVYLFAFLVLFYIDQSSDQTTTDLGASTVTVSLRFFSKFLMAIFETNRLNSNNLRP